MKKDRLNQFVFDQIASTQQSLSHYLETSNPEHLHDLRVSIKKIKALFSFSASVYKKRFSTSDLKTVFHEAGNLREIQLHIHALIRFPQPPFKLIESLCKKEHQLKKKFKKSCVRYLKHIKHFKKHVDLPDKLPEREIISAYFDKQKRIAAAKLSDTDREEIHEYRRIVKNMLYVYAVLPKSMQQEIDFDLKEMDKHQEELGEWHDTYASIHFLSKKKYHLHAQEYMSALIDKEKKQFNRLFHSIRPTATIG